METYHRHIKESRTVLDHYEQPPESPCPIEGLVDFYNHRRYHKALENLDPHGCLARARGGYSGP